MVKSDPAAVRSCGSSGQRAPLAASRLKSPLKSPRAPLHLLEALDRRVLLSAAFVPTTTNLHDIQHGPLAKAGGNLADLYFNYRSAQRANTIRSFDANADAETNLPGGGPLDVVGDTVGVELVGAGNLSDFEQSMKAMGLSVQSITPKDNAIAGFLPITMLSEVAQSSDVLHITPLQKPTLYQEGKAPDQADQALQALGARTANGLTGAGVTVGVISDSVNQFGNGLAGSVSTGDLPNNVKVIQDGVPGDTDEGRAILEEIYDLAPGANLVFDTAGNTQQSMATAVTALQSAGCNVIIDDFGYEDEPFFQPGVIDAAIDSAVSSGVTYVTAAGNDGAAGFEQAATFVAANDGTSDQLINFNPNGTAATMMTITFKGDGPSDVTLEWDDEYDGVTGNVKANLEINLYSANGQTLEYSGVDNAFATGVPVQTIPDVEPGTYQVQIVATDTPTASLPGYYEFTGSEDSVGQGFTSITAQYSGLHTSIIGHSGLSNAISVGAVAFNDAPAFTATKPIPTEDYSSAGPVIEARDANGNLLPTAQTIDVPEVSGVDGNNTSFFIPGDVSPTDPTTLPQFFGTSAAAGNVAGVVALLKQAVPGATQAQILTALETTAIPVNGQTAGTYNASGGFGLINAAAAVTSLIAATTNSSGGSGGGGTTTTNPPSAVIVAVNPNPRSTPVSSIDIDFNEPVSGFGLGDLVLSFNGGSNLLTVNQTLSTNNDQDFVLGNLSSLTAAYGDYTLALNASTTNITGTGGLSLLNGASTSFLVEAVTGISSAPTNLTATAESSTTVSLTFDEPFGNGLEGYILQRDTNPAFTGKVTTLHLSAATDQYTDTKLTPGTVYYYQIEAFNADGTSAFSHAATVIEPGAGEVTVDTNSGAGIIIAGEWFPSTEGGGYEGVNYIEDGNADKGRKSVRFRPNLSAPGEYDIYGTWTRGANRATNVPFDVFSKKGVLLQTVRVNERSTGGDGWSLIGEFFLHSSTASFVRIRNTGTNGEVIANAIKFLPVNDIERNDGLFTQAVSARSAAAARITHAVAPLTPDNSSEELQSLRDEVG